MQRFNCCMISSFEKPLDTSSSLTGVKSRILSIYGRPIDSEKEARKLYNLKNYGVAGVEFINKLIDENVEDNYEKIVTKYEEIMEELYSRCENKVSSYIQIVALVILGDILINQYIFKNDEDENVSLELGIKILEEVDSEEVIDVTETAHDFVRDLILSNYRFFDTGALIEFQNGEATKSESETHLHNKRFGIRDGDIYYIFPEILRKELENNGFSYRKTLKEFGERGYIKTNVTNSNGKEKVENLIQKKYKGVNTRMVGVILEKVDDTTSEEEIKEFKEDNGEVLKEAQNYANNNLNDLMKSEEKSELVIEVGKIKKEIEQNDEDELDKIKKELSINKN